jgi:UDP-N-acetylglucosamine 4,6-dehydratase/5-epimerase
MGFNELNGASLFVTGGTGSFGRALLKTLLNENAGFSRLVIYSRDELKQFEMQQELSDKRLRYFIGDVRDRDRLTAAMQGIDFVIHAAALKQVPAAEYNPMEFIKTNVNGAENVIHAALANGVHKVIALSTDKAAHPINLYGATKLCSDKLFVAANNFAGGRRTRFAVTRYGNVVGSRGSVLPHFRALLKSGAKSLPITDARMTRFWITLEQGVAFVLANFARMQGGEIFVPKLPSIRIVDLAQALAPDTPTNIIGIRPGEKLHEIMCPGDEAHLTIEYPEHFVIHSGIVFFDEAIDYAKNPRGEHGSRVVDDFEYHSGHNPHFLTVPEIRRMIGS